MTDQLFLSIWLDRQGRSTRLKQFEKLLQSFPFSHREQPQSVITVHAISNTEPAVFERLVNAPVDLEEVLTTFRDFPDEDVAYGVEAWWDIWQFDGDWKLGPARVALSCFGPEFDNGTEANLADQETLRIDFGVDSHYLPQPDIAGSPRLIESNIKSLLRVVHEIDSALPVERRRLETESGENFANRLQESLMAAEGVQ